MNRRENAEQRRHSKTIPTQEFLSKEEMWFIQTLWEARFNWIESKFLFEHEIYL